jgi:hypothetical protein
MHVKRQLIYRLTTEKCVAGALDWVAMRCTHVEVERGLDQ